MFVYSHVFIYIPTEDLWVGGIKHSNSFVTSTSPGVRLAAESQGLFRPCLRGFCQLLAKIPLFKEKMTLQLKS
jgi:hypothetical protein